MCLVSTIKSSTPGSLTVWSNVNIACVHLDQPFEVVSKNDIKVRFEDLLLNTLL